MKTTLLIGIIAAVCWSCSSCVSDLGSATPGYWAPALQADPGARFGVLIEQAKPIGK